MTENVTRTENSSGPITELSIIVNFAQETMVK